MQNIHKHSYYSNLYSADAIPSYEEYAKRAVELGHKVLSSVEHGWQGYYHQVYEIANKYDLKCVIGTEAYWVKDRHEQDKGNHHILICAKSNMGRESINDILSEANISGYYYRPRIDLELLMSLPPKDVFVTSACIAFNGYDDIDSIIKQLHDHFGENFMLEVQAHNTPEQIAWNSHLLELSDKWGIDLFAGIDSHYIYPQDNVLRDDLLASKGVHYENEDNWFMDYPDDTVLYNRFLQQGIFEDSQIKRAMSNPDIALDFCDYDTVRVFMKDIKLPSLYPDKTQEEKNQIYTDLIHEKLEEYLIDIPEDRKQEYRDGVDAEIQTYIDTGMVDYPLLDYAIVNDSLQNGCLVTSTGRGSAVGFFTNTLCGFSKVDRFTSAIKLYPERFISTTRILSTKSLPDIDLNCGTPEILEESQKRIMGEEHAAPMIAFGTLKKKSAFKIYAKSQNMDFELANKISNQISQYDEAVKLAEEDEKDEINIEDYVDAKYLPYLDQSKKYWGIVSDKKKAPCAFLLYDGNIRREIGLIKCKSESTKKEYITCCVDGAIAENYKFLKNDILKVDVVLLISKVFDKIGIKPFNVNKLIEFVTDDEKVWDLYAKGYTLGLNQVEKEGSTKKCMAYKPHNVSELSAFVAAIRPGFKSMYDRFEQRVDFKWGIPSLDNLLRTKELPVSFLFFQEQVMSVLNYAGFPMDECYGIIKAIAKKHPEKVKPLKEKFIIGFRDKLIESENLSEKEAQKNAEKVWTIVNDNCGYGFNCVSGTTKIIRGGRNDKFIPTVEEMYKIKNDYNYAKKTGHLALRKKYKRYGYGQALSMFDDDKLRPNDIVDIYPAGERQTYKVTTESGCWLICTNNHRFPTPYGKKRLDELKVGDELYCKGEYEHKNFNTALTDGNFESNVPQKGEVGFQNKPNGVSVIFEKYREYCKTNKKCCEMCGREYSKQERFEVHHKDFDRLNNCEDNYTWLCCSCHKKIHYNNGRTKRYENGINTYISKIVSIEPHAVEMTYDIEMKAPAHTFVSESGLVTSNSAHAFCMALDSLYQAWQKANYPYAFYEVLLQHYSEKGNKEKVAALKQEMKKAFGINTGTYKFGADNRSFVADKNNHVIYPAMKAIKGFNNQIAEELYTLSQSRVYDNFIDLLIDITEKTSCNSRQLDILVKLDYFSDFGEPNQLTYIISKFALLYVKGDGFKSTIKQSKLGLDPKFVETYCEEYKPAMVKEVDFDAMKEAVKNSIGRFIELNEMIEQCEKHKKTGEFNGYNYEKFFRISNMPEDIKRKYATKVSEAEYKGIDAYKLLTNLQYNGTPMSIKEKIKCQQEYLSYIDYTNPNMDKRYVAVTNLDTKYSPKFVAYCLRNGQTCAFKVRKNKKGKSFDVKTSFNDTPFENGDILCLIKCKTEPKAKFVDGEWVRDYKDKEWWCYEYTVNV